MGTPANWHIKAGVNCMHNTQDPPFETVLQRVQTQTDVTAAAAAVVVGVPSPFMNSLAQLIRS
jgi:hypothetical protein